MHSLKNIEEKLVNLLDERRKMNQNANYTVFKEKLDYITELYKKGINKKIKNEQKDALRKQKEIDKKDARSREEKNKKDKVKKQKNKKEREDEADSELLELMQKEYNALLRREANINSNNNKLTSLIKRQKELNKRVERTRLQKKKLNEFVDLNRAYFNILKDVNDNDTISTMRKDQDNARKKVYAFLNNNLISGPELTDSNLLSLNNLK